jgi:hypothetical protein
VRITGRALRLAFSAGLVWTGTAHAQAWLPAGGSGDVSASYTDTFDTKHYLFDGSQVDAGHIRYYTYNLAGEYSPTDRLMLNASVPVVRSIYMGAFPHPTSVDDGTYHTTYTDLRAEAHYQWLLNPLAVAPYVAYTVPLHHYETLGHAAPGRGLHETWLGVAAGKSLDKWIKGTFVDARFTYAIVQKVHGISHDKENIEAEVGHFLTPELSVQALFQWQKTLGGIPLPVKRSDQLYWYHDILGASAYTNLGVGASWSYSDSLSFFSSYVGSIEGKNGHKLGRAVSVGLDYQLGQH